MKKFKRCPRCGETKSSKDFFKCTTVIGGLAAYCKKCSVEKNSEYLTKYMRDKYAENEDFKQKVKDYSHLYKKQNPEKNNCHSRVYYALKHNIIQKEPCKICGSEKVHAHHTDYSKPLDVTWLCSKHHQLEHVKIRSNAH